MKTAQRNTTREQTLEFVYRANYAQLLAYAQKLTLGDRTRAEDIVQETMVRAWQHIDELKLDQDAARPWLFTVARRISIDGLRARASRPPEVNGDMLMFQPEKADRIEDALTTMDLRNVLKVLSPDHREVLVNLYLRGRTSEETAAVMGIPNGTVKSRCFHALRAVRRAMTATAAAAY